MALRLPLVLLLSALVASEAAAFPAGLAYAGRLTEPSGAPRSGPVDLTIRIFDAPSGGALVAGPFAKTGVPLSDGAFQVQLEATLPDAAVWIEIEDVQRNVTLPRQRLAPVPFASRVPVDGETLRFDDDGKLSLLVKPVPNQFLGADASGNLVWTTPSGGGTPGDATTLSGEPAAFYRNASNLAAGTVPYARLPIGTGAGTVAAGDDARFTDSRAPSGAAGGDLAGSYPNPTIGASRVTSSHIVDGTLVDADVAATAAIATTKLSGAVTSITGHGLGTAATKDVGTAAGQLVELEAGGKLPAVDGSQLTGLPAPAWASPGAIGATTPASGTFSELQTNGDLRLSDGDGANTITLRAQTTLGSDVAYTLPGAPDAGKFLTTDAAGNLAWAIPADGGGSAGDMTKAEYDTNNDGIADNAAKLGNQLPAFYRDASNLNAGTVAYARLPVGTAANTVAAGDDSRFTDSRAPTGAAGGDLAGTYPNPTIGNSRVTSSHIVDGTIVNADVSATAAIATTKLSGAVTSITGHGLGTAATKDVGTTAGNVVEVQTGSALPALSGAALTNLNAGALATGSVPYSRLPVGTAANTVAAGDDSRFTDSRAPTGAAGGDLAGTYPNPTIGASRVTSTHIVDGTIVNADVSATAAIATTKLSGAVTSITGHGLGTAATKDVGTTAGNVVEVQTGSALPALSGANLTSLSGSAIASGTVPYARLPVGTAASTVAAGNDARFTDSRTPTGAAGGDLSGTYPNPTIGAGKITSTHIVDGAVGSAQVRVDQIASSTTAAMILHVNALGDDAGACTGTGAAACKTITGALAKVPTIIRHDVTINVNAATYAEMVLVYGYTIERGATFLIQGSGGTFTVTGSNTREVAMQVSGLKGAGSLRIKSAAFTGSTGSGLSIIHAGDLVTLETVSSTSNAGANITVNNCRVGFEGTMVASSSTASHGLIVLNNGHVVQSTGSLTTQSNGSSGIVVSQHGRLTFNAGNLVVTNNQQHGVAVTLNSYATFNSAAGSLSFGAAGTENGRTTDAHASIYVGTNSYLAIHGRSGANAVVRSLYGTGIQTEHLAAVYLTHVTTSNNGASGTWAAGLHCAKQAYCEIHNTTASSNKSHGVHASLGATVYMHGTNVMSSHTAGHGLSFMHGSYAHINGTTTTNSNAIGIYVALNSSLDIYGTTTANSNTHGVAVSQNSRMHQHSTITLNSNTTHPLVVDHMSQYMQAAACSSCTGTSNVSGMSRVYRMSTNPIPAASTGSGAVVETY